MCREQDLFATPRIGIEGDLLEFVNIIRIYFVFVISVSTIVRPVFRPDIGNEYDYKQSFNFNEMTRTNFFSSIRKQHISP